MLEKIENSIADAQMVLVGIGAEMEADMDGKDASFYDSLKEQAERDPAAAQLFRFMQAQKKGQSVGIGAEMEADMDGKDASFYDSLKEQAERDPAAAQLFRFMQAQKKGQRSREELEKSYQKLSKLLEGKNYFIVSLCDDGLIYEAGFDTERVVTPAVREDDEAPSYQKLSKLLEGKNYFIVSLCDDGLIYEAGFDTERVVTPAVREDDEAPSMEADDISNGKTEQLTPAGYEEKDWQRYMKWLQGILNRKLCMEADDISNGKTEQLTPAGYEEKDWQRYMKWLQGILNRKLCILELGAGMEAPQVIRFAFEKITFFNQKAYLYRVHSKFPQLTEELKGRGCSVAMHPAELLKE